VLSAARIARLVGVSQSTAVRLAASLGFSGFPELQAELQREVLGELDTAHRLERAVEEMPSHPAALLDCVLREDAAYILECVGLVSPKAFEDAVRAVADADRVFIIGLFQSAAPAHTLALGLRLIGVDVRLLGGVEADAGSDVIHAKPGDVLVAMSQARYPSRTVTVLDDARASGCRIIAITDHPTSPLATRADTVLVIHRSPPRLFQSLTSAVSLANALVTAVALAHPERSQEALRRAEEVWQRHQIFMPAGRNNQTTAARSG
jgi:DNA-binding MurR/RpiR family transcriptional regulator